MTNKHRYIKEEGSYKRDGISAKNILTIGFSVCLLLAISIFFFTRKPEVADTDKATV